MSGANKPDNRNPASGAGGFLVLDKPEGITSMGAVAAVRRRAGGMRTGHAGTLDPLATGVLLIALGSATKVIDRFMATEKRYQTEIDLSAFTSTDDREGVRTAVHVDLPPTREMVEAALGRFVGQIQQRPPAFSAVKVGGRRAYKLARRGEAIELAPRPVTIHEITLRRYDWPIVALDIHCDKGVYVRALARNLGEALGTGGHCRSIRRTAVGPFTLSMAIAPDDLPESIGRDMLIPVDSALAMLDRDATDRPAD